jgi:hypothetical protein
MADGNYGNKSGYNGPRKEPAKYALRDYEFRIVGRRLEGAARPCSIGFTVTREGVAFTAYTNIEGDQDDGKIVAPLTIQDAMLAMVYLENASRLSPGSHNQIVVAAKVWPKRSEERKKPEIKHQATIIIGRNDHGVIYVEMRSWRNGRPPVVIDMLPSNFVRLIDKEGNQAPADKVSEAVAVSWAKTLSAMMPLAYTTEYARTHGGSENAGQGGGGNRGSGNGNYRQNNNDGGGGYQNQSGGGNSGGGSSYGGQQQNAASSYGGGNNYNFGGDDLPM